MEDENRTVPYNPGAAHLPYERTIAYPAPDRKNAQSEQVVRECYLLCQRKQFDAAEKRLLALRHSGVTNPDVENLLARIAATQHVVRAEDSRLRSLRYMFGLNTLWRRLAAYGAGIGMIGYGGYGLAEKMPLALRRGFGALLTSQVNVGGRRPYFVDWTRPVYYDLVYSSVFLLGGVGMLFAVRWLSRGVADWEELDMPDSMPH